MGERRPRLSAGQGRHPPARPRLALGARSWFAEPRGSRAPALPSSPGLPQPRRAQSPLHCGAGSLAPAQLGVREEGAPLAVRPLECGRLSAPFLSLAPTPLGGRGPPLLFPCSGSAGSGTRLGRLALRAGTGEALPRYPASGCRMRGAELDGPTLGGQLSGPGSGGVHSSRVSRGQVDTFVASCTWKRGWGGVGWEIGPAETRPLYPLAGEGSLCAALLSTATSALTVPPPPPPRRGKRARRAPRLAQQGAPCSAAPANPCGKSLPHSRLPPPALFSHPIPRS